MQRAFRILGMGLYFLWIKMLSCKESNNLKKLSKYKCSKKSGGSEKIDVTFFIQKGVDRNAAHLLFRMNHVLKGHSP